MKFGVGAESIEATEDGFGPEKSEKDEESSRKDVTEESSHFD